MKIWKLLGHSLFAEDETAKKVRFGLSVVFFVYFCILIKCVVFKYPYEQLAQITESWTKKVILEGLDTANFTLFKTIKMYIRYWARLNSFENLFGNIFLFSPFGFLLPFLHKESRYWWILMINVFWVVCGIEIFQLITAFGAFDVDDILLNCLGAFLGYLCFGLVYQNGRKQFLTDTEDTTSSTAA
ncbi:MAG: VanZ family protein [Lachnospiraceae bacterium]|nr:VanZ family protein [Lachnospiraceae bacterium]